MRRLFARWVVMMTLAVPLTASCAPTEVVRSPVARVSKRIRQRAAVSETRNNPSGVLPQGSRAVTLPITSEAAPVSWLRAGDRIDVALVTDTSSQGGATIRLLAQGVLVLSIARTKRGPRTGLRAGTLGQVHLVVAVFPREAQALALASRQGRLVVFLRNPADRALSAPGEITAREVADPAFWRRQAERHGLKDKKHSSPACAPCRRRDLDIAR